MFKKVRILFVDEKKEGLGMGVDAFFWEKGVIDFSKVIAFHVFIHEITSYPYTEIYLNSGKTLVVDLNFETVSNYVVPGGI